MIHSAGPLKIYQFGISHYGVMGNSVGKFRGKQTNVFDQWNSFQTSLCHLLILRDLMRKVVRKNSEKEERNKFPTNGPQTMTPRYG